MTDAVVAEPGPGAAHSPAERQVERMRASWLALLARKAMAGGRQRPPHSAGERSVRMVLISRLIRSLRPPHAARGGPFDLSAPLGVAPSERPERAQPWLIATPRPRFRPRRSASTAPMAAWPCPGRGVVPAIPGDPLSPGGGPRKLAWHFSAPMAGRSGDFDLLGRIGCGAICLPLSLSGASAGAGAAKGIPPASSGFSTQPRIAGGGTDGA